MSENSVLAVPASTEALCRNCGAELSGRFCADCGQRHKHLDPTLHDLVHEIVHEFLHLDGKIVTTLKALLFSPGRISSEFLAGRRATYIGPVRLYLTLSLLFFLITGYSPHDSIVQHGEKKNAAAIDLQVNGRDAKDSHVAKVVSKAIENPEVLRHAFLSNLSRVMFAVVPLFALGLRMAYRNRKKRYPAFVYFSLHYHSFVFLALTVFTLTGFLHVPLVKSLIGYAVAVWILGYLFFALRKVFGGSNLKTVVRMGALAAFYLPCLAFGAAVAGVIALFTL